MNLILPTNQFESVSPLKIILTSDVSETAKFVSDEISTEVKNPLSLLKSLNVISDISFLLSSVI